MKESSLCIWLVNVRTRPLEIKIQSLLIPVINALCSEQWGHITLMIARVGQNHMLAKGADLACACRKARWALACKYIRLGGVFQLVSVMVNSVSPQAWREKSSSNAVIEKTKQLLGCGESVQ